MFLAILIAAFIAYFLLLSHSQWRSNVEKPRRDEGPDEFVYTTLESPDSMRLLQVLPSRVNEPIQVQMTEHQAPPSYRCLSYMWGNQTETREILVNGQTLRVRKNLYDYLKVAAKQPFSLLWVDAICINQDDDIERAQQVQRMGTIYREAEEVVIWMGVEGYFKNLIRWIKAKQWTAPDSSIMRQLKEFVYHPYWERAWITQEVLLAQTTRILHSSGEIDWTSIGPMNQALIDQGHADAIHGIRTSHPIMLWKWQSNKRSIPGNQHGAEGNESAFWGILGRRVKAKCYDPRDRIYSLLALDDRATKLAVDYREPPACLFWRAGEQLGAWSNPQYLRILCGALELDYRILKRSLAVYPDDSITISVRHTYVSNPLRKRFTGVMVCQNGYHKHTFPFPQTARHGILLCPSTQTRVFDDSLCTHALVQPTAIGDSFTVTLSRQIFLRHSPTPEPVECQLCHCVNGDWAVVTSWSYLRDNLKPETPNSLPSQWMLRVPMKWVVQCVSMDESNPGVLLRLPSIESEQFVEAEKKSWFGTEPVKHKFARYMTDAKRAVK